MRRCSKCGTPIPYNSGSFVYHAGEYICDKCNNSKQWGNH